MRTVLLLLLATIPTTSFAGSQATVFAHECKQIDPKMTGFECRFNEDGMQIYWHEKASSMKASRREAAVYEFERLALRYVELGGRHFKVRFSHWAPGKERNCWRRRNVKRADYYCVDE